MRQLGLVACQPRPWRPSTTQQGQAGPIPDLVNRDFSAEVPGAKMVGDITYIPTWEGWVACQAFITHPAATRAAATQALAATTGIRTRDSELAALFAHQNCTLTPGIASITAQAKTAAATGITRPVTSWTDLYDLRPR